MNPHTHFLFPFALGLVFANLGFLSIPLVIIAACIGVFVDIDHYIEHILHTKKNKFSLKSTWNNSMKYHKFRQRSFIHDGSGIVLLTIFIIIVSFFSWPYGIVLGLGYYSHLLLDYVHMKKEKFVQWKNMHLHMRMSYEEVGLDILLVIFLITFFII